jgi:hypothetical protein
MVGPHVPVVIVWAVSSCAGVVISQAFKSPDELVMLLVDAVVHAKVAHDVPAVPDTVNAAVMPMPLAGTVGSLPELTRLSLP